MPLGGHRLLMCDAPLNNFTRSQSPEELSDSAGGFRFVYLLSGWSTSGIKIKNLIQNSSKACFHQHLFPLSSAAEPICRAEREERGGVSFSARPCDGVAMTPFLLLLLFLAQSGCVSSSCPMGCSCQTAGSILCYQRRSHSMPRDVPASTKTLYLFANDIRALSKEDFAGLEELEMLDLSQNKVADLPERVFQPLSSLRNLDLSANQIVHVSRESFYGTALLERLYLYSNRIESIHPEAFDGLGQLLELKLQSNRLQVLPALNMPLLLLLDLRSNSIPVLGPEDIQAPRLESLKLAGLGLESLDEDLMESLGNLHELDISRNKLGSFPPALRKLTGLNRLSLAGNPMGPLRPEDLQNLGELQELDISNLSLQDLPEDFPQLFRQLQRLTVAENPFNCLCTLAWFPGWLRSKQVALGKTEVTRCHFPPLNAGKVLERLEHRDFGCPATTTVATSTAKSSPTPTSPVTTPPGTTPTLLPLPPGDELPSEMDDSPPAPASPSPSSSADTGADANFCPSNNCLNGGTCQLDPQGHLQCSCPRGTAGSYCEIRVAPPPEVVSAATAAAAPDISSRLVTSTSILLDLHRYVGARPWIRGVRLTYRNLSGADRRPTHLNIPTSYPEYTLRGLKPNSTYSVCASPLGEAFSADVACIEAHTASSLSPATGARVEDKRLTTMLAPALGILLLLVAFAVATGCYLRRRRSKGGMDLDCDPSQLELNGVKAGLDKAALPQKHLELLPPQPALQNGELEYEVMLMQDCTTSNSMGSLKPSYF